MESRLVTSTRSIFNKLNPPLSKKDYQQFLNQVAHALPAEDYALWLGMLIFMQLFREVGAPVPFLPPENGALTDFLFSLNGTNYKFKYPSNIPDFKSAVHDLKNGECGASTSTIITAVGYDVIKWWGEASLGRGVNQTVYEEQEACAINRLQEAWDDWESDITPFLYMFGIWAGLAVLICTASLIRACILRCKPYQAPAYQRIPEGEINDKDIESLSSEEDGCVLDQEEEERLGSDAELELSNQNDIPDTPRQNRV